MIPNTFISPTKKAKFGGEKGLGLVIRGMNDKREFDDKMKRNK